MHEDKVVELRQPGSFSEDPLTEVLRVGARQLLAHAIETEVSAFIETHADLRDDHGRRRIVRHGHLPEREIQTGIGAVSVRCPRVRDRGGAAAARAIGGPSRFSGPIVRKATAARFGATYRRPAIERTSPGASDAKIGGGSRTVITHSNDV